VPVGSKRMFKSLLKAEQSFYDGIEGITGNYDFVHIAQRGKTTVSSNSIIVIDPASATTPECLGRISDEVLELIQELLESRRLVLLMQHLYVKDARYPDPDLHREVRLYTLEIVSHGEPTYIRISNHTVYVHLIYPAITI
jgi:hypothetical protein